MKRLWITGISGLLGSNLAPAASRRFEVIGIARNPSKTPGVQTHALDLIDREATLEELRRQRPDAILHTAANANVDNCEQHPAEALLANAEAPRTLAEYAVESGCRLVHVSTDAFFNCPGHRFREDERPNPMNFYGESKLRGEEAVLATCPGALVARTNFFGWNPRPEAGMAEWTLARLVRQERLPLFSNVEFTPLEARTLADTLLDLCEMPSASGVLHVAGADSLTKLEFGRRLARAFGLSEACIVPMRSEDGGLKARRSAAMSLDITRLQALFPKRDFGISAGLRRFHDSLVDGHAATVKGIQTFGLEKYRTK